MWIMNKHSIEIDISAPNNCIGPTSTFWLVSPVVVQRKMSLVMYGAKFDYQINSMNPKIDLTVWQIMVSEAGEYKF